LEFHVHFREAWRLVHGVDVREDPRLQVMRARAFACLRKNFAAEAEYAKAVQLLPDDKQLQLEVHRNRGYSAVGRREWSVAAAEFTNASALAPNDPTMWRFMATAHFAAGNRDAYRRVCEGMMSRFATTNEPRTAGEILRTCVLTDDSLEDMSRLLTVAETSDVLWHWGTWARGAAWYRAGKYQECVRCFESSAQLHVPRAWEWCFLAMAHHRLGNSADADRCLAEGQKWIDAANRRSSDDATLTQPHWMEWGEPALYAALLQEAQALVRGTLKSTP
jgi:predicted Zn-dependent protease